ncbi:hypothetical protein BH11PLA2_BH11PLA2_01570 [soil metagenome]
MADPLFGPELRLMLDEEDTAALKALCEDLHPATVADAVEDFSPLEIWQIISPSSIRTQAAIFEYLPPARQLEMVDADRSKVGQLLTKMSHDDRVDLLRRLPVSSKEALLRLVDEADRKDIGTLFEFGENTVGALMTTDYAWLPPTMSAAEAIDQLRQQAPDRETIYYVYVLDEVSKRQEGGLKPRPLLGVISLRDLILAPRHAIIRDFMKDDLVTLKHTDDASVAAELLARYDFIAMPVVDAFGGMLGIITHDDVIDILQEEATEDLQRGGAISPLGESYMDASFYKVWRKRAAWLSLLFVAELGTFSVLSYFEDAIAAVVVLALFVPLCISVGGNSGSQASTLITRSLALGEITPKMWKRVLRRELVMGIVLGLTLGGIAFVRGYLTPDDTRSGPEKIKYGFNAKLPDGETLQQDARKDYILPRGTHIDRREEKSQKIRLPEGASPPVVTSQSVEFPADCESRSEPVSNLKLGVVISAAVMAITLWGSLVGASLPLIFRRFGFDPAVASGPFVATFVDITGIAIFFAFASWLLL